MVAFTYKTRIYLHGAFAAFVNGLATGFTMTVVDPADFNVDSWHGLRGLLKVTVVSGLFGFATYIKTHPLPDPDKDTDATAAAQKKIAAVNEAMKESI